MTDGSKVLTVAERANAIVASLASGESARVAACHVIRAAMLDGDGEFICALIPAREAMPGQTTRTAEVYVRATLAQIHAQDKRKAAKGVTVENGEEFRIAPALSVRKLGKYSDKYEVFVKTAKTTPMQERALKDAARAIKMLRDIASACDFDGLDLDSAQSLMDGLADGSLEIPE